MPATTRAAIDQAQGHMDQASQIRQTANAEAIPQADEPLKPAALNSLKEAVAGAIEAITAGQIDGESILGNVAEVAEDQDRVPPDLGQLVLGIGALVKEFGSAPALAKYAFDPVAEMKNNAGLAELAGMIDQLGRDKKAVAAFSQAQGAEKGPAPDTETEQPAADNLEQE